jgi:hypothetical protein
MLELDQWDTASSAASAARCIAAPSAISSNALLHLLEVAPGPVFPAEEWGRRVASGAQQLQRKNESKKHISQRVIGSSWALSSDEGGKVFKSAATTSTSSSPLAVHDCSRGTHRVFRSTVSTVSHAAQLPPDDDLLGRINAVNLEHVLGEIQTDRGNLHVDGSSCDSSNNDHPTALRVGARAPATTS